MLSKNFIDNKKIKNILKFFFYFFFFLLEKDFFLFFKNKLYENLNFE